MAEEANLARRVEDVVLIIQNVTNLLTRTKEREQSNFTESYLNNELQALNQYWANANQAHAEILALTKLLPQENLEYFRQGVYENLELLYEECEIYLTNHIDRLQTARFMVTANTSHQLTANSNGQVDNKYDKVKLQRLEVPKFSGDYTKWITFRDAFISSIHDNTNLTGVQKFQYLLSALQGDAYAEVEPLTLSDENYEIAWEKLNSHYENKFMIVSSLLNQLYAIKPVHYGEVTGLKAMCNGVYLILESLRKVGVITDHWDPAVIHPMVQRFDPKLKQKWQDLMANAQSYPNLGRFYSFLDSRIRSLEAQSLDGQNSKVVVQSSKLTTHAVAGDSSNFNKGRCSFCNQEHLIYSCAQFEKMSIPQRHQTARDLKLCWNRLCKGHGVQTCRSTRRCRHCNQAHHSMLHLDKTTHVATTDSGSTSASEMHGSDTEIPKDSVLNSHLGSTQRRDVLLATAEVKLMSREGRVVNCRALIDQGSQASFISESVTQLLRLKREKADVANITSYKPSTHSGLPSRLVQGLQLADPDPTSLGRIDLLIGAETYGAIIQKGLQTIPDCTLVAQNSLFGWLVSGGLPTKSSLSITVNHVSFSNLDERLQSFWALEEIPSPKYESQEHKYCENLFQETTVRQSDGRFVVRLPFKSDDLKHSLGSSKGRALSTLQGVCNKLKQNDTLRDAYHDFLGEYERLGHMTLASPDACDDSFVYLPHHGVYREDKLTTKLRVVFNASAPTSTGVSLNDVLCIGPKLHTDIPGVILNWRLHKFVFCTDIIKMFRQILIHPADRPYQCILWRTELDNAPNTYLLNTVTYGTAPAPFLANRVIREIAESTRSQFPLAYEVLAQHIYVDDLLFGADDKPILRQIRQQVTDALKSGGFELQKWVSNDSSLLAAEDKGALEKLSSDDEEVVQKLLGVNWCRFTDSLHITIPSMRQKSETKRNVLSDVASLFDPLGLLSPIIIKFKMFMQSLWILKLDWDEPLPESMSKQWRDLISDINRFDVRHLPRWLGYGHHTQTVELIGFCDASRLAYSAVVYMRVTDISRNRQVNLLMAKSRVAPLKTLSIPRLELCGAVLLKTLMVYIMTIIRTPIDDIWCFTDSKIVLAWLEKPPYQWSTFVANRVSIIQNELSKANWRHVGSRDNPADLNSRGVDFSESHADSFWWKGPTWLTTDDFGGDRVFFDTKEEQRPISTHLINTSSWLWNIINRYSIWSRLIRILAHVYRFIHLLKPPNGNEATVELKAQLRAQHIMRAKVLVLREHQSIHFGPEIHALKTGSALRRESRLRGLNPFLDHEGLLRVGGRLSQSNLDERQKHPIVLKSDAVVKRLVLHVHLTGLHSGTQLTINLLRQRYWLLKARDVVKGVIRSCVTCIRHKADTARQIMGDLPSPRCTQSRPFSHTGLDYTGPFDIRTSSGRGHTSRKGCIAVFVCTATRAIHIEVVSDYSTQGFLAAFDRFTSRRGLPAVIYSDNGTNFKGADTELRRALASILRSPDTLNRNSVEGLEWHFIPPSAPHFGGLWEAGVKSLKTHLRRVLQNSTPTFEELITVTSRIEACLNSRPLAPLNDDPESLEVLTPGHFLVGSALKSHPTSVITPGFPNIQARWSHWLKAVESIWRKWKSDYLNSLQVRGKWQDASPNIQLNDIVILKVPNTPPCHWPLARVMNVYPGKDEKVRVV